MPESYDELIGKVLLIGLSYYSHDGKFIEDKQLYGRVTESNESGITITQADGEEFSIPPDLSAIEKAAPGDYTLCSTKEVVKNPDYLARYNITLPE